jgi:hypothetical protein
MWFLGRNDCTNRRIDTFIKIMSMRKDRMVKVMMKMQVAGAIDDIVFRLKCIR